MLQGQHKLGSSGTERERRTNEINKQMVVRSYRMSSQRQTGRLA